MKPRLILALIAAHILLVSSALAAVVTVDVTVKLVNPQARGITVVYKTELGEKTIELDVSRKAEITLNGKEATLDSLGAGLKAKVSFDRDLAIVTKIEAKGTAVAAKKPELIEVSELNDEGGNDHPCLCEDGLTIFWHRRIGQKATIWTAHRENPDAPFADKKSLFSGFCPTVSSDGLEMILAGDRIDGEEGRSLHAATREAPDKAFGRPKEIASLQSYNSWAPRLSSDGLTLYFTDRTSRGNPPVFRMSTRTDKTSPWSKAKPFESPSFEEPKGEFSFITPDGLTLFGQRNLSGQGMKSPPSLVMLCRSSTKRPFREPKPIEVNNRSLFGTWSRYVAATHELFFVRIPVKDGHWDTGRQYGIWVIKNFSPTDVAK